MPFRSRSPAPDRCNIDGDSLGEAGATDDAGNGDAAGVGQAEVMAMTPEQCRAVRVLAKIDRNALALEASVSSEAIQTFETGFEAADGQLSEQLRQALKRLGVDFLQ